MSAEAAEIGSIVQARFEVKDTFNLPDGELEFSVAYREGSSEAFAALYRDLSEKGYVPRLTGTAEQASLLVRKKQPPRPGHPRTSIFLLIATLTSLGFFALLEYVIYGAFAPGLPGYLVVAAYSGAVVLILGAYAYGHRRRARSSGMDPGTPYFVPGIPYLTTFLPALGVISSPREPAVNKDAVFDLAMAGPLLVFAVAAVLWVVGVLASVNSSQPLVNNQVINPYVSVSQINPSLFQFAADVLLSPLVPSAPSGYVRLSPIGDAATVGLLLAFLNFLPMGQFDGGVMATAAFGEARARIATFLCVLVLVVVDFPNYFVMAILVLIISGRQAEVQVLDEVSPISRRKKYLFALAVVLAVISLPFPQTIAGLPLG